MKNNKFVMAILIPIFIHLSIFVVLPIIGGLVISLFDYNPLHTDNVFVGLDNFMRLLIDPIFFKSLINTFVFVGVTVTLNICLSLVIAQGIARFKSNKTRSIFRMLFFMPCVAPLVASSVVWGRSILTTKTGLINIILNALGIHSINWLGDPAILMISMIIFTLWADIGYNIILFSAGIDGIPSEYYEAAGLDGANEWQKFIKITIPLLSRTFTFVTIMTIISHFQMFAQFSVMIMNGGPQNSGNVLTYYIYKMAFQEKNMGYAAAISFVLFIIILIISMIQQKLNKTEWEY